MKKIVALSLALAMGLSLAACGGTTASSGDASATGESSTDASGVTLRLVNGKIEVDAQLKELAELYKQETGVTVEIQSMGGGVDIQSELKNYYQADNMPDIPVAGPGLCPGGLLQRLFGTAGPPGAARPGHPGLT